MLQLKNIVKQYKTGDTYVEALKGIDIEFRKSEFVSILGPSGCGKTTMLNIIGGLDQYTNGDLVVNGISTKEYKSVDWDIYRNNSIGFVFQNYNLIQHQTVLSNVELAMTLAGISKTERRKRAAEALVKVGLGDQLNKKPNQMSGGQMQRVAIARALVNNPDILLADEPTGALDSETSVQIMEILKEIAKERLIIMVTHNPEIATTYSTRIIRLLDGKVINDSDPYKAPEEKALKDKKKKKKISMSFPTALSLSLNNLMTKKARTLLTSFAGSIGIIGIALILSLSHGMQTYIDKMEKDTLSTYPIQIESQTVDVNGMMSSMMGTNIKDRDNREQDKVYSNNIMTDMMKLMSAQVTKNDLNNFKAYIESEQGAGINDLTSTIQYGYNVDLQIYKSDTTNEVLQVNPSKLFRQMAGGSSNNTSGMSMFRTDIWAELLDNPSLLEEQYNIVQGKWPENYDEIVLVVNKNNEISDAVLYSLGLMDQNQIVDMMKKIALGEDIDTSATPVEEYSYDDLLNTTFKLVLNTDYYTKEGDEWVDQSTHESYMKDLISNALELKVVGILKPDEEAASSSIGGTVGYLSSLTKYVINQINDSEITKEQKAYPEINVFTGLPFDIDDYVHNITMEDVNAYMLTLTEEEQAQMQMMLQGMPEEQVLAMFSEQFKDQAGKSTTYEDNIELLGIADLNNPNSINLYPLDFEAKEGISDLIEEYNQIQIADGKDEYVISYSDILAIMMSSVTNIINIITYVLIAFVAISLVVSSIMIGIITYISVLERTKEIGILRSIGASKHDVSRVFNAETVIVGFVAGALGIVITMLLNIPINIIIKAIAGVSGISALPLYGAVGLIAISVLLTVIAGLFPSKVAARKDPVEALRSE